MEYFWFQHMGGGWRRVWDTTLWTSVWALPVVSLLILPNVCEEDIFPILQKNTETQRG